MESCANETSFFEGLSLATTNNFAAAPRSGGMLLGIHASSLQPAQERRAMRRFDMRLPASVKLPGVTDFLTETQNVSARGVFFYLDRPLDEGSRLEVTLTFPPHVTLTDSVRVRFMARVVRVEDPLPASRVGIAAFIEEYEFLRSAGDGDYAGEMQEKPN
jgi:PilZ domain